jgi:LemA protein
MRNQVRSAWSDIDVQLTQAARSHARLVDSGACLRALRACNHQRRHGASARAEATGSLGEKARLEHEMEAGLHRLVALAESYPELKADGNFLQLQRDLVETEDHLQYARRFYNGAVRSYNTRVETFPDMLVAKALRVFAGGVFRGGRRRGARGATPGGVLKCGVLPPCRWPCRHGCCPRMRPSASSTTTAGSRCRPTPP